MDYRELKRLVLGFISNPLNFFLLLEIAVSDMVEVSEVVLSPPGIMYDILLYHTGMLYFSNVLYIYILTPPSHPSASLSLPPSSLKALFNLIRSTGLALHSLRIVQSFPYAVRTHGWNR